MPSLRRLMMITSISTSPCLRFLFVFLLLIPSAFLSKAQLSSQHAAPFSGLETGVQVEKDALLTFHSTVNEVNVVFVAMDKRGRFIRHLSETDLRILDDHKPPAAITRFHQETDLPLYLGLLIDVSGSIDSRFIFEQNIAIGFMKHTIRTGSDQAFITGFNKESYLAQDFTDNTQLLGEGIRKLKDGGGTALYDAIYHTCQEKFSADRSQSPARNAIVIISDGEDNLSEFSLAQAIEMAMRTDVVVYAISTNDTGQILHGDRVLARIAEATGGRFFLPLNMNGISASFASIEDELHSEYAVSYRPAGFRFDGKYRPIEISVLRKNTRVRVRPGYFAPVP